MKKSKRKKSTSEPARSKEKRAETKVVITPLDNIHSIIVAENRGTTVSFFIIALTVVLCLLPFSNKAFNIDDPLFIWTANQIQIHPTDFYGFNANWYLTEMPVYQIQKNPPLVSYYLALVIHLFGAGEIILHIAFILPAVATVLGIYNLAKKFCSQPLLATLISVMTPAFLVSSNTIMCDITMLCFWVWAVFFWIQGLETNKKYYLFCSGIFISLSALTKYYGICLVPLLFVYAIAKDRSLGRWALYLFIPLIVFGLYCWATYRLYGYVHFFEVFSYVEAVRNVKGKDYILKAVIGLAFLGGGFVSMLFFWPFLWRRAVAVWIISIVLFSCFLAAIPQIAHLLFRDSHLALIIQIAVFVTVGLSILFLVVDDLIKQEKSPAALLICLWVIGTFVFATFVNWTTNVRTILPIAPVLGILIMRRIDFMSRQSGPLYDRMLIFPVFLSMILSLFVVWADYSFANSSREAASIISAKYISNDRNVWFQGHWGFQYYMEKFGGKPIDFSQKERGFNRGDIMVIPSPYQNTSIIGPPKNILKISETIHIKTCSWLSIMNAKVGAAFYGISDFGPIPLYIGPAQPETYYIFTL